MAQQGVECPSATPLDYIMKADLGMIGLQRMQQVIMHCPDVLL